MTTKNQKFSGLTDDQVLCLLERIATTINLMADLCREKAEEHGGDDIALSFHALETLLCGIGALADLPTGGAVVGGFSEWMVGPVFNSKLDTNLEGHHAVKS